MARFGCHECGFNGHSEWYGKLICLCCAAIMEYGPRSVAAKIGCSGEILRNLVGQTKRDEGLRPGPTSEERERNKSLERKSARTSPGQRDPS